MNASADIAGMAMTDWPDEQSKSTPYAYGAMYDGLGKRRIEMVTGAQGMTWFRYGLGWKPLSVHEGDASAFWTLGARTISAVSLGHTVLAMTIGTNPADPLGTVDFLTDHLGSARGILYGTDLVYEAEYTPYGDLYWDNGSPFGVGFTCSPPLRTAKAKADTLSHGHLYDVDTQLYYAPYRWYSPQTARWTTRDPLGMVDGPNVYAYVRGNPVLYLDPLGACRALDWALGSVKSIANAVWNAYDAAWVDPAGNWLGSNTGSASVAIGGVVVGLVGGGLIAVGILGTSPAWTIGAGLGLVAVGVAAAVWGVVTYSDAVQAGVGRGLDNQINGPSNRYLLPGIQPKGRCAR